MKDLLPVFIDLKIIKCPLQPMSKRLTVLFPQVHEMCLKSHVAQMDPSSMMFVNGKLYSGSLHGL